jgi:hypothetical protein
LPIPTLEQIKTLVDAENPTSRSTLSSENPWMVIGKADGLMMEARVGSFNEAREWLKFLLKTANDLEPLTGPPWFSIKHNRHPLYRQTLRDAITLSILLKTFPDSEKYLPEYLGKTKSYSIPQITIADHKLLSRLAGLEVAYAH